MRSNISSDQVRKPSLLGILFDPGEQFQRIMKQPRIIAPLIWLLLLYSASGAILSYLTLETPEGRQAMAMMGSAANWFFPTVGAVTTLFYILITLLVLSGIQRLLMMVFQGEASFTQLLSLNTHLYILPLLASLIHLVVLLIVGIGEDTTIIPSSLAAVIPADGALRAFLAEIEVFAIWKLVLSAIGLAVIGRVSKGKAWAIALIPFILWLLVAVGMVSVTDLFNADIDL